MNEIKDYQNAVDIIKTAILQSQARAAKAVNQEQLALYYGIGRYISDEYPKQEMGNWCNRNHQQSIAPGTSWSAWILACPV